MYFKLQTVNYFDLDSDSLYGQVKQCSLSMKIQEEL